MPAISNAYIIWRTSWHLCKWPIMTWSPSWMKHNQPWKTCGCFSKSTLQMKWRSWTNTIWWWFFAPFIQTSITLEINFWPLMRSFHGHPDPAYNSCPYSCPESSNTWNYLLWPQLEEEEDVDLEVDVEDVDVLSACIVRGWVTLRKTVTPYMVFLLRLPMSLRLTLLSPGWLVRVSRVPTSRVQQPDTIISSPEYFNSLHFSIHWKSQFMGNWFWCFWPHLW